MSSSYIRRSSFTLEIHKHNTSLLLLRTLHSLRESLRAQNLREQASETSSSCDICTGRRTIKFLGSATLRDCSLVRTTTSRWCARSRSTTSWRCALLYDYFLLLPEGRSWDCTASILPASTNDRLLQAAQHVDCWERHRRCLRHWSCLRVQPDALTFICCVLSVPIQIKREHEQSL